MTAAEEAEARYTKLHPPSAAAPNAPPAPAPVDNTAPAAPSDDAETTYKKLHPPAPPSDEEVTSHNFWNLPPGVSQSDYWGAEGRKVGGVVGQAAADTGLIFGDDMSWGAPGFTGVAGQSPADYRAAVQAARDRAGGGKYGIDAMAFLANKPFQTLRLGYGGAKLAAAGVKAVAPTAATDTVKAIARRVGNFVEGGAYTGAQSAGHGDDPTAVAANTAIGGGLGLIGDEVYGAAKDAGSWLRSKWGGFQGKPLTPGTPEGTPAEIAAGPPPGSPARTAEQDLDAQQMNLWRSQSRLTSPPSQADVGNYATKVYGEDPAQWPAALRDLHNAAGKEGGPSIAARTAAQIGAQGITGVANYLGFGLSPEFAAVAHPVVGGLTEQALPALTGYGANPTSNAINNAFPALTGWRNAPNMPDWRY